MKRNTKIIIVVAVVLAFLIPSSPLYSISPLKYINEGGGADVGTSIPSTQIQSINGQLHLGVVYLAYGKAYDGRILNAIKQVIETDSATQYSVISFYAKYGVTITPSYYSSSIGNLIPTLNTQQNLRYRIIGTWMHDNPTTSQTIYNEVDMIGFFIDVKDSTWPGDGLYSNGGMFLVHLNGIPTNRPYFSYIVVHEIGHAFCGPTEHYLTVHDSRCVMNMGGDGYQHLTKGTIRSWNFWSFSYTTKSVDSIFGATDLTYAHFTYFWRTSYISVYNAWTY